MNSSPRVKCNSIKRSLLLKYAEPGTFNFVLFWWVTVNLHIGRIKKRTIYLRTRSLYFGYTLWALGNRVFFPRLATNIRCIFGMRSISYSSYAFRDIIWIYSSVRSSNRLTFSHSDVAPSTRPSAIAEFVGRLEALKSEAVLEKDPWKQYLLPKPHSRNMNYSNSVVKLLYESAFTFKQSAGSNNI